MHTTQCNFCGNNRGDLYDGFFGCYCDQCLAIANRLWDRWIFSFIIGAILLLSIV